MLKEVSPDLESSKTHIKLISQAGRGATEGVLEASLGLLGGKTRYRMPFEDKENWAVRESCFDFSLFIGGSSQVEFA
jgi:hypothetical protein